MVDGDPPDEFNVKQKASLGERGTYDKAESSLG